MLNFNTIDNTNTFANSIPLHGDNFTDVPTSMVATSLSSSAAAASTAIQVQQINLNYLNANTTSGGDHTNWSQETINNNNCNRTTINNNLTHHSNASAVDQQLQKSYHQATISSEDQINCRPPLNMDNFLQQKGSENVKRFSVNNLLQLANNCRALVDEHRISSGEFEY